MLTSELKDKILKQLISVPPNYSIYSLTGEGANFGISDELFNSIIDQFKVLELITLRPTTHGFVVICNASSINLINSGGFEAQDALLIANLEKLSLEIELLTKELSPNLLDRANKIASIVNSITGMVLHL